jgi:hypothetical protein
MLSGELENDSITFGSVKTVKEAVMMGCMWLLLYCNTLTMAKIISCPEMHEKVLAVNKLKEAWNLSSFGSYLKISRNGELQKVQISPEFMS